jgi:hypothetical protein
MMMPDRQPRLIHVKRPVKGVEVTFEPATPLSGPITDGPLIPVSRPMKSVGHPFEPVATPYIELGLPLSHGVDADQIYRKLNSLVRKVNEMELLFDRAGVWVDGLRSGVREGMVVIVLTPNDPADPLETCKRIADQLFATTRPVAGVLVTVRAVDQSEMPLYPLAP